MSLEDFLNNSLPDIRVMGSSSSLMRCNSDREEHPTEVLQWPSFLHT